MHDRSVERTLIVPIPTKQPRFEPTGVIGALSQDDAKAERVGGLETSSLAVDSRCRISVLVVGADRIEARRQLQGAGSRGGIVAEVPPVQFGGIQLRHCDRQTAESFISQLKSPVHCSERN